MADVFLAERMGDDGFRTRVALKRLHRGLAMDTYFIRQLVREARLLGQLEHANIVKVYDLRHIGDEYYVVMEYVDGIDLAAVARVHRRRKTRIPRPFFFHVALSLSEALAYAHSAVDPEGRPTPLIHRDLKPSNVMLSRRGIVKLTDFGIAHVGDGSVTGGLVQGTANYMSPEQAFGEDRLTPASDVYSLGSVFYEMLTGRGLVDGDNYLKAIHQVRQRRVSVEELAEVGVEPGLRMVIAKMLSADIDQRYQEMDSVRNDLQFVADRLKVDLSWHRIRSYVGRLMGILGRAPDRATLSNLKVASEYSPAAKNLAAEPSAPAEVEPSPEPRKGERGPVTQAVAKDLLDSAPGSEEGESPQELVIGDAPKSEDKPNSTFVEEEDTEDTDHTVAMPDGKVSAQELLERAARLDNSEELPDESTAVAGSESWAQGNDEATAVAGAQDWGPDSAGGSEPPGEWGVGDEEETKVYDGQSPRQTGVVGAAGGPERTPAPAHLASGAGDSMSQLGPAKGPESTSDAAKPVSRGGSSASGDMWVFDDSPSSAALTPMGDLTKDEEKPKKRRRRRKKKKKKTMGLFILLFFGGLVAIAFAIVVVLKSRGLPPFEAPPSVSAEPAVPEPQDVVIP